VKAIIHHAGEGEQYAVGASEVVIKATGDDTGGAFFFAEVTLEARFPGPPAHYHERLHETLYVLEGELTITLDGTEERLGPGSFASIPPGVVHTFRNDGDQPARGLNVNAPAGWEQYLRELAGVARVSGLDPALMAEIASRHDFHRA
jgi:quercetin dioxygenase-like cupin family protein